MITSIKLFTFYNNFNESNYKPFNNPITLTNNLYYIIFPELGYYDINFIVLKCSNNNLITIYSEMESFKIGTIFNTTHNNSIQRLHNNPK